MMNKVLRFKRALHSACLFLFVGLMSTTSLAAPSKDLWQIWDRSNEANTEDIDHSQWGAILQNYLVVDHPSGVNRFRYSDVVDNDKTVLSNYLEMLQSIDPRDYSLAAQKAYWINFYNALTVQVILNHYPVSSIKKTGKGFFSGGPWGDKLVTVAGERLTLNDIEHRILRPIWDDARIHFAVNCASIGCPPLLLEPYTASNTEALLERSTKRFLNHPHGVKVTEKRIVLSKLFDWYQVDFGTNEEEVLRWISRYAEPSLAEQLSNHQGGIKYEYDWSLNQP